MPSVSKLLKLGIFSKKILSFIARYEFPTNLSAPLSSPYIENGGSLSIVDSGNLMPISNGLYISGRTNTTDPSAISSSALSYSPGTGFFTYHEKISAYRAISGFGSTLVDFSIGCSSGVSINTGGANTFFSSVSLPTKIIKGVVLGSSRTFYMIYDGSNWVLWFISSSVSGATARKYGVSVSDAGAEGEKVHYIRLCQLQYPWVSDWDMVTNRLASPAINDTINSLGDAVVEMTWSAVTNAVWELSTRMTDDDNRWIVRCSQTDGTIKLIERNVGIEIERGSASQTWANGTSYRVVILQDGNTFRIVVGTTVKITYTLAIFNNTATTVKTDKAGTNLISWPRYISGAGRAELNKWTINISPL